MNIVQAVLMGAAQGLSEFLPISSSAHIVFTSSLYKFFTGAEINLHSSQEVFLDIMLHLGTLAAVLIFFRKEISAIIKSLWKAVVTRDFSDYEAKLGVYIILGTFFTVLLAYPLKDIAEKLVYTPQIVGVLLIITGVMLFISEFISKRIQVKTDKVTWKSAVLIGLAQGLAALPGLSRSGWTIATGLFAGLDRLSCARFSFLLSIPIILGASAIYPLTEIHPSEFATYNWSAILIGTVVSGIVGYLCIKYFLKFLEKFTLSVFAYYCLIIGFLATVFFIR